MPRGGDYAKTVEISQYESYLVPNVDIRWGDGVYAVPATFRDASLPYDPDRLPGSPMQSFQIPSPIIGKYIRIPAGTATGPGLSFQDLDDNDTGLYLSASNNPAMTVNGSQVFNWNATRMVFVSGYKVGIGTTGPDRALDILDASNPQLRLTYTDGSVYNEFQTDSSGYLIVTGTGHQIHVRSTLNSQVLYLYSQYTSGSNYARLAINSSSCQFISEAIGGATGGEVQIGTGTGVTQAINFFIAGNNRWRMNTSGHIVNIGSLYNIGGTGDPIGNIYPTNIGGTSTHVTSASIITLTRAGGDLTISTTTSGDIVLSPVGSVVIADGKNIAFNTGTGTKIGTGTTQLFAFWNAAPTAQPSSTGETTGWTSGGGSAATSTDTYTGNTGTKAYTVNDIVKHLKTVGLMASS